MTEHQGIRTVDDERSVGSRINWGSIVGGTVLALGFYFLFATLGAAVGLSVSRRVNPKNLEIGAISWTLLTGATALFLGGLVTSLFTTRENRVEAILHGVIMWSFTCLLLLVMGNAGINSGFNAMASGGYSAFENPSDGSRTKSADSQPSADEQENLKAATRIAWYAFAGTWISMLAAAGGAVVGLGPTFRIVPVVVVRRTVTA